MSLEFKITKRRLIFKKPAGTSRGILVDKPSWIIEVNDNKNPTLKGIGECSVIPGLSPDFKDEDSYLSQLKSALESPFENYESLPSIHFGIESAMLDLKNGGKRIYFDNDFSKGQKNIPINGLVWMGSKDFMLEQIETKLSQGFTTIKLKIGAIEFEKEIELIQHIRSKYSSNEITIRVDANGAFKLDEVEAKLKRLANFEIHSIEQPIKAGLLEDHSKLCAKNILPIALDEELIGVNGTKSRNELLSKIRPQFIILKPSLHGGISGCKEWIKIAESLNIKWWMTSALESNIGLNVISQFTAEYENSLPQGLGTGGLFENNLESNLTVQNGFISLAK